MCKSIRLAGTVLALTICSGTQAQIVTDGSVGAQLTLTDTDVEIGETLGTRSGNNLFHSFQTFNIDSGGSATFTGASDISHVISRVTGGEVSNIQGILRSQVGEADFYFVNPAGVVFGPNSSVDVPASLHVGTAQQIRFSDGTIFESDGAASSTLSIASPEAFGFTGSDQSSIEIQGALLEFGTGHHVLASNNFFMEQGEFFLSNGELTMVATGASTNGESTTVSFVGETLGPTTGELITTGAAINVFGGAGAIGIHGGDVQISDTGIALVNFGESDSSGAITISAGDLVVNNGSQLVTDTVAQGSGGLLQIDADQFTTLDNAVLTTGTSGAGNGGNIRVTTSNQLVITNRGQIIAESQGEGNAGTVSVHAGELVVNATGLLNDTGRTGIFSSVNNSGSGGDLMVTTSGRIELSFGGSILSETTANGTPATIAINANELAIFGNTPESDFGFQVDAGITTVARGSSSSSDINVNVDGELYIGNGGSINSSSDGSGDSGFVTVQADQINMEAFGSAFPTGVFSTADGVGNGGNVSVSANGTLFISNGARIGNTERAGANEGRAGTVFINAAQLLIDGDIDAFETGVFSEATGSGDAGDIVINVSEAVHLTNTGQISALSSAGGKGGSIILNTHQLFIEGGGIRSDSRNFEAAAGGDIFVSVRDLLSITSGGEINAGTSSNAAAGSVTISAGQLLIDGSGSSAGFFNAATGIFSQSNFGGEGGDLNITTTGLLQVVNGGTVSTTASDTGGAGSITVDAGRVSMSDNRISDSDTPLSQFEVIPPPTGIFSSSQSSRAGPVTLRAREILMNNSQIVTSTDGADANGGQITIDSRAIVLDSAFIQANALSGQGGDININTEAIISSANQVTIGGTMRQSFQNDGPSVIQAVAPDGINGAVDISAPDIDLSGTLAVLDQDFRDDVGDLAANPCAAATTRTLSTLTPLGRGGLPVRLRQSHFNSSSVLQTSTSQFKLELSEQTDATPTSLILNTSIRRGGFIRCSGGDAA